MITLNYDTIASEDRARLSAFATVAYSTLQGVQHTFLLAEHILKQGIAGTFCECGVASGALSAAMAYALLKHKESYRGLHMCDSFEGIPLAGPKDTDQPGIGYFVADVNLPLEARLRSSGISAASVDNVKNNMANWGLDTVPATYWPGWFQHTLPSVRLRLPKIALLRLDGDLYESTQCCLANLYDLVKPGGIVILDDYPLSGSRTAFEEFFAEARPEVSVQVDTGAGFWIKPC